MVVLRYTVTWNGFVGAPGYTNLHFMTPAPVSQSDVDAIGTRVKAFFGAVGPYLPSAVTLTYPTAVQQFEADTGLFTGDLSVASQSATTGVSSAAFPNGVGACITWNTNLVLDGKRIRGRTFLVPLATGAYQNDGTLDAGFRSSVLAAAETLRQAAGPVPLGVWRQPSQIIGEAQGAIAQVSGARMTDKTAVLRSRRD